MRTWIMLALLASAALAGCAGEEPTTADPGTGGTGSDDDQNETGTQTTTQTSSATAPADDGNGTVPTANNTAPTADLSADVLNGTAPLLVNFTLNGTDADGDDLTWTLAINGTQVANGTEMPATVNHNFTQAGNKSVVLAVSDGINTTEAAITVVVSSVAAPTVEPVVYTGSAIVPDPWAIALGGCLLDAGRRDAGGPGGITGQDHPIQADWYGWTYSLDVSGVLAEFWSDEPAILGAGSSGTVPEEATYVVVCIDDAAAADTEYTLTLSPP